MECFANWRMRPNLLKKWSGRRGSNPQHSAWELQSRLKTQNRERSGVQPSSASIEGLRQPERLHGLSDYERTTKRAVALGPVGPRCQSVAPGKRCYIVHDQRLLYPSPACLTGKRAAVGIPVRPRIRIVPPRWRSPSSRKGPTSFHVAPKWRPASPPHGICAARDRGDDEEMRRTPEMRLKYRLVTKESWRT